MNPNDCITYGIDDAHRQLGITRSALYLLLGTGEIASIKIGRRRLITRRSLEQFIAKQEREQGSKAA
ncbi:helix-turn-helix domain-containing protein [Rhodanobacter sp. FW102-FHT14D06]|uniref:Helix-turn-helix domain-containing protein n=2 Tax=unclassified Rhodanobacter TaxID=2621553 RepID=A0AB74V071_9GAMM